MDSQAIVNTMEVLDAKPINDLAQEVTIKVCYVSDSPNRNGTVINRDVGKQLAATLPGAPIVGFYDKETGDFEEHSKRFAIKDGEFIINDITSAYGFVSPTEKPWYQDFEEDGTVRTYLMCKGYLWTRQYAEAAKAVGKGQSMELNDTMSGFYQGDVFVFTEVTLDKLCILGDAFEPCFEGSRIMTTYAAQYQTLAEQLESLMGRRYFIMNDKLVEKKAENVSLDYAIGLGWDLSSAVAVQMNNRGMVKYTLVGVYSEGGEAFCIVQNVENLEYARIGITIYADETVELASDVVAVKQSWSVKSPATPPLAPVAEAATIEVSTPDNTTTLAFAAETETETEVTEPTAEFTAEIEVTEPTVEIIEVSEPTAEFTEAPETKAEVTEPTAEFTDAEAETVTEVTEPTAEFTEEQQVEEKIPAEPENEFTETTIETDLSEEFVEVTDYKALYEEAQQTIAGLTEEIAAYKSREIEIESARKDEVIASYNQMLTTEEIEEVAAKKAEYSLEELDAKLALLFTKKVKEKGLPTNFQVNVEAVAPVELDVPEFIKQAKQYDESRQFHLQLVA